MGDDPRKERKFVLAVARNLEQRLNERLADESSKRPRVLTENHLLATVEAVKEAVFANSPYNSWPSNEPLTIAVSADKENQWLREALAKMDSMDDVKFSPCVGRCLDLQIRQGDHILANMESELGGNRQRAEDMAKLTEHETQPLMSIMMVREKSHKNLDGTHRNLVVSA